MLENVAKQTDSGKPKLWKSINQGLFIYLKKSYIFSILQIKLFIELLKHATNMMERNILPRGGCEADD